MLTARRMDAALIANRDGRAPRSRASCARAVPSRPEAPESSTSAACRKSDPKLPRAPPAPPEPRRPNACRPLEHDPSADEPSEQAHGALAVIASHRCRSASHRAGDLRAHRHAQPPHPAPSLSAGNRSNEATPQQKRSVMGEACAFSARLSRCTVSRLTKTTHKPRLHRARLDTPFCVEASSFVKRAAITFVSASVAQVPRQRRFPLAFYTQIAVVVSEPSSPGIELSDVQTTGRERPA